LGAGPPEVSAALPGPSTAGLNTPGERPAGAPLPCESWLASDRRGVGKADIHKSFPSRQWAEVPERPESVNVEVLLDTCSIEVFAAGGLVVITDLVFF